jgi:Co/Zn/Cd efflux system component
MLDLMPRTSAWHQIRRMSDRVLSLRRLTGRVSSELYLEQFASRSRTHEMTETIRVEPRAGPPGLRRAVTLVGLANLAYFGVEFSVALAIGSVSLFADSVDFLEDASVNFLIVAALGRSAVVRARVGMVLAGLILVPGLATLWTAFAKLVTLSVPDPVPLSLAGAGALAVNLGCAIILARYRHHSGSLTRAAFLSARNDTLANIAIVATGFVTAFTLSAWPDLVVGLGIAALNADAAREVFAAARDEHREASP